MTDTAPRQEGFWRDRQSEESSLPWPAAPRLDAAWTRAQQTAFLYALDTMEGRAKRTQYRGVSRCRLCGCPNGSGTYTLDYAGQVWTWPEGYRHYINDHQVEPSADFREWIEGNI